MNVILRDSSVFMAIPPREVAAYLRARGWKEIERISTKGSIWIPSFGESAEREILLPLDNNLGDFTSRMAEVIQILSDVEKRSQLEVIADVTTASADIIRIRLDRSDILDGTVPLQVGVQFVERTRDLVVAASCAAVTPRPFYQSRWPKEVADYIQKVRLGQTGRGSFVVNVVSRVPPELQTRLPIVSDEPFERRVTITLATGLEKMREASEQAVASGTLDAFQEGVALGVSANLCESIAEIAGDEGVRAVDIDFSWAVSRPPGMEPIRKIRFPSDAIPFIREAGRILRESAPQEDTLVRGMVTKLNRQPEDIDGAVTILGIVEDKIRNVRIRLPNHAYELAHRAHGERKVFSCLGDLERQGKNFVLTNPRNFVIEDGDDED